MAKIEPVQIWTNGQNKTAEVFNLAIIADNLDSSAQFYYELKEAPTEEGANNGDTLACGNLSMGGQEYQDWDDSNASAYEWAAEKLSLILV